MPTSRSLELINNHPNISESTTLRFRLALSWLALFAEVALFAAGIFCLVKCGEMRETESERQLRLAAQGLPAQSAVTLDEALQALDAGR
jgi:hypothetical protein